MNADLLPISDAEGIALIDELLGELAANVGNIQAVRAMNAPKLAALIDTHTADLERAARICSWAMQLIQERDALRAARVVREVELLRDDAGDIIGKRVYES